MWQKVERDTKRMLYVDQEPMERDQRIKLEHNKVDQWDLIITDTEPYDSGQYILSKQKYYANFMFLIYLGTIIVGMIMAYRVRRPAMKLKKYTSFF